VPLCIFSLAAYHSFISKCFNIQMYLNSWYRPKIIPAQQPNYDNKLAVDASFGQGVA